MIGHRGTLIALAAAGSLFVLAGTVLLALSWTAPVPDSWGFRGFTAIFAISFGGIGALVAYRRPENRVGWLLLLAGLLSAAQYLAEEYSIFGVLQRPGTVPFPEIAGWFESWVWVVIVTTTVVFLPLLFPDGHLPSGRWRLVVVSTPISAAALIGLFALSAGPLNNAPFIVNPFGIPGLLLVDPSAGSTSVQTSPVFFYLYVLLFAHAAAAAVSVYVRFRSTRGAAREQIKWFALGAAFAAIGMIVGGGGQGYKAAQVFFIFAIQLVPISVAIAVLRYRLYDIDIVINRALVYGITTAMIGAVFFAGIVVLQSLLRPLTGGSQVAVAISTLLCFGLFQPVRRRAQRDVDRRFYRAKYDASRTLDAFTERLGGMVELGAVRASLLDAVGETFAPTTASVWLASVTLPGRTPDRTES